MQLSKEEERHLYECVVRMEEKLNQITEYGCAPGRSNITELKKEIDLKVVRIDKRFDKQNLFATIACAISAGLGMATSWFK